MHDSCGTLTRSPFGPISTSFAALATTVMIESQDSLTVIFRTLAKNLQSKCGNLLRPNFSADIVLFYCFVRAAPDLQVAEERGETEEKERKISPTDVRVAVCPLDDFIEANKRRSARGEQAFVRAPLRWTAHGRPCQSAISNAMHASSRPTRTNTSATLRP